MKTFDAFEIHCNFRVSGITACDTFKFLINRCKVYNGSFDCICIENDDRAKTVTEIQTDETDHNKIIDWLINVKKWLKHDRDIKDKYVINMLIENDVNSVTYDPRRNESSFYTLELYNVIYWTQQDYAEYEPVKEVPTIKLPRKGTQFSLYTKVPGIYIKM